MAYTNNWNSSDQVALRAITTGQIGLFGEIDPTDGGDTSRFMLSTRFAQSDDVGLWKANAYLVKETMNLFNNFTWFTTDPMNGDQFHQHRRSHLWRRRRVAHDQWHAVQPSHRNAFRRANPLRRHRCQPEQHVQRLFLSNTLVDHVDEGNVGIYAQNTTRWTDWFRTTAGWRGDYFWASVNSILQPANSGNPKAAIGSPKFTMTFGPFYKTELFLGAGMGYHSNDARGVTATQVAGDPTTPQDTDAVLGSLARRRDRRPHQGDTESGQLHQPFLPAPGLGAGLRGGYRYHRSGTAKSAHRHRDHQQLPARLMDAR